MHEDWKDLHKTFHNTEYKSRILAHLESEISFARDSIIALSSNTETPDAQIKCAGRGLGTLEWIKGLIESGDIFK